MQSTAAARNGNHQIGQLLFVPRERLAQHVEELPQCDRSLQRRAALADHHDRPSILKPCRGPSATEQFNETLGGVVVDIVPFEVHPRAATPFPAAQLIEIRVTTRVHQGAMPMYEPPIPNTTTRSTWSRNRWARRRMRPNSLSSGFS